MGSSTRLSAIQSCKQRHGHRAAESWRGKQICMEECAYELGTGHEAVKNLTLPPKSSGPVSVFASVSICLGLWFTPDRPTMWLRLGGFGLHSIRGPGNHDQPIGAIINQSCLCSGALIKTLRLSWVSLVGSTLCVLLNSGTRKVTCPASKLHIWYFPWAFLPLADFNPFPSINLNYEHSNLQWVL